MKKRKTLLFLYSELAEYFLACIGKLLELYEVDVHIIRWELNTQAPFDFNIPSKVNVYSKENYRVDALHNLAYQIDPDLVFCCGWMDNDYIAICKHFRKKQIPVIAGVDNHWQGTPRQYLAQLVSRFTIQTYYSHIWVAGDPQREYAKKLGFNDDQILWGYYSANVDFFRDLYYQKRRNEDQLNRRFIYVGRYLEHKGLLDLWQAFIKFQENCSNDWELWCLGTGPLQSQAIQHPKIKHFGFIQPEQFSNFIKNTDVFVLPSHNEPWGVVVHEFAAAGFPLICTEAVGAASAFLENEKNGYLVESRSVDGLKRSLQKMASLSTDEIKKMGRISAKKAQKITPKTWSNTLMMVLE